MDDLIVGALEERRIDADDRAHPFSGKSRGKGDCMLLGNPDIEEAIWIDRLEFGERRTGRHRRSDGHDPWIGFGELDHRLGENVLVLRRRWRRSRRRWR